MKKIVTIVVSTVISLAAMSQTKKVYTLSSFPTYDENGNAYQVVKEYDHLPTAEDSVNFKIESDAHIDHMIDSVANSYKAIYNKSTLTKSTKGKKNVKANRYTKRGSR